MEKPADKKYRAAKNFIEKEASSRAIPLDRGVAARFLVDAQLGITLAEANVILDDLISSDRTISQLVR